MIRFRLSFLSALSTLALLLSSGRCVTASPPKKPSTALETGTSRLAVESLRSFLDVKAKARGDLADQPFASKHLTRKDAVTAKLLLLYDRAQQIRLNRAAEMKARKLSEGDLEMPFYYKIFGKAPVGGRSLYISMHGGGGAPKRVNDEQWENQKRLYRLEEGVYLVPRAPTDTWNLWHQAHIDRMFGRLIENMIVFEGVNPNRVYLMGYSAGGDGVYQLAPRMADRFAAAAMMAGHPNETSPVGLRNIAFTIHVGGRDAGYNRNKIADQWAEKLAKLREADRGGYEHLVKIYPDKGHWMDREDAAAIPWMAKYRRKPLPAKIVWKQDNVTHSRFYWLAVDDHNKKARAEIVATRQGQHFAVESKQIDRVTIRFNDELVDFDKPVSITWGSMQLYEGRLHRTIAVIAKSLDERFDPDLVFSCELSVNLPRKEK